MIANAGAALASSQRVVSRALNFAAAAPSSIRGSGALNNPQGALTPPRQASTSPSPVPARVCEGTYRRRSILSAAPPSALQSATPRSRLGALVGVLLDAPLALLSLICKFFAQLARSPRHLGADLCQDTAVFSVFGSYSTSLPACRIARYSLRGRSSSVKGMAPQSKQGGANRRQI